MSKNDQAPAYSSYVRNGSQLSAGVEYKLELVGDGEGSENVTPGQYYLATTVVEKEGRLMVHTGTGFAFHTDASDVYSV